MNETFMKEKPVLPLLLSMALPMVLSMLVNSLYNIVDSYFVAKISEDAMTALSLVFPVQNFINAVGHRLRRGHQRRHRLPPGRRGPGEGKPGRHPGPGALPWCTALCWRGAGMAVMPAFLRMFTSSESVVVALGVRYSVIVFCFSLVDHGSALRFEKIFQAVGRMKVTMVGLAVRLRGQHHSGPAVHLRLRALPGDGHRGRRPGHRDRARRSDAASSISPSI